ncbi:unnamed protein product [Caenorhabditis bovis]|uniref:Cation/H+ exchanger transmembrane domain-containing protein n=1 Tax=Caenorhabditis bovis TaxID=2654633 RepID=A0A8S1EG59_9PELO|nr:unnamed protein product [Caenorhabditis bovis]
MQCVSRLHNTLHSFFNHREINAIITSLLIFVSFYIAIVTLFGENFLQPLADHSHAFADGDDVTIRSIFIVFLLLFFSLIASKLAKLIWLPPLFGSLLLGIFIRNVAPFDNFFFIPPYWDTILRKLAFVTIVIRWGLAIDLKFIYENAVLPATLGLVSCFGEIVAITLASFFILNISFVMAIFCGLILALVSPAVTVPTMIKFRDENMGIIKRIPDNVLATCCIDNVFGVIVFMILSSIIFTNAPVATTILLNAGTIVFGMIGGIVLGLLLWRFPRSDAPHTQFSRIALIGAASISLVVGTFFIKYACSGLIASLILGAMCSMRWSADNENKLMCVESSYKFIWDIFAQPILFVLLGMKFDCSNLTWEIVFLCLGVIAIGLLIRIILSMLITLSTQLNFKEQIVVSLSLLPRATLQAELGPTLVLLTSTIPEYAGDANLILKVCILSVLVTAPIFDLLLSFAGSKLLTVDMPEAITRSDKSYMNGDQIDATIENIYTSRPKSNFEYRSETVIERY